MIVVLSHKDDLHALAVQESLRDRHRVRCHVIETDDQMRHGSLAWRDDGHARLKDRDGDWLSAGEAAVIWHRRTRQPQRGAEEAFDEAESRFITVEWRDALFGVLSAHFRGVWVNDPSAIQRAETKILQLKAARDLGLRTPRTFVGQDPETASEFFASLESDYVTVKKVRGTRLHQTQTLKVATKDLEAEPHVMRVCPAIYQEVIEGREHLRIHVFGDRVLAVRIETETFDWRTNLDSSYSAYDMPESLEESARALTRELGLEMAIIDAKLTPAGEVVWLEVNQQGQFLFMQALSGVELVATMADFLAEEAR